MSVREILKTFFTAILCMSVLCQNKTEHIDMMAV